MLDGNGDPEPEAPDPAAWKPYILRTVRKEPETGCWIWQGPQDRGYPRLPGLNFSARRIAYLAFCGDIPPKKIITTSCTVRECVAPEHLMALTRGGAKRLRRVQRGTETACQVDIRADGTAYVYTLDRDWEANMRKVKGGMDLGNGEFLLPAGAVKFTGQKSLDTKNQWIAETRARIGSADACQTPRSVRERGWTGWKDEEAQALGLLENRPDIG